MPESRPTEEIVTPDAHRYDDIIHLPHPTSPNHPRMERAARAAQFSSFAALTGFEDVIDEVARTLEQEPRTP